MRRKSVLYVVEDLERGGAERVVVNLATRLNRERFEPVICCLAKRGALAGEVEQAGIQLHVLGKRPGIDPAVLWRLHALVRRLRPDVIHTHLFTGNAWGRAAGWLAGTRRIVASEHSVDLWKNRIRRLVDRLLALPTYRLIAKSEAIADFYKTVVHIPAWKVVTIRNGIDLSLYGNGIDGRAVRACIGVPQNALLVGTIGRLSPEKGQDVLVEALRMLKRNVPDMRGIMAGDGPSRWQLERLVRSSGMQEIICLLGHRNDVPALLSVMDIFVLPSHREGLPLALLEAMATGLPVVATDVGGCGEVIRDGHNGLLVAPGRPELIAGAIKRLACDEGLRRSLGHQARRTIEEHFSVDRMVRQIEELYLCDN